MPAELFCCCSVLGLGTVHVLCCCRLSAASAHLRACNLVACPHPLALVMDFSGFALEIAMASIVIVGHAIGWIRFRMKYGRPIKCDICNLWLNGREQWERHQKGYKHHKHMRRLKRARQQAEQVARQGVESESDERPAKRRRCEDGDWSDWPWSA